MLVIPAIDLKNGQCVRLLHGEMSQATIYSDDPGAMAQRWQSLGCERLHLVDLDGAFAGHPVNKTAIQSVLQAVDVPVQLGGGIRTLEMIENYLSLGVANVILGTVACHKPEIVIQACRLFPGRITVGIDGKGGIAAVSGWVEATTIPVIELAKRFENAGVLHIIFTDIGRDGALTGPNIAATRALAEAVTTPIIASGGVSSLGDIDELIANQGPFANHGCLAGVITGKALYDGRLDFAQAVLRTKQSK